MKKSIKKSLVVAIVALCSTSVHAASAPWTWNNIVSAGTGTYSGWSELTFTRTTGGETKTTYFDFKTDPSLIPTVKFEAALSGGQSEANVLTYFGLPHPTYPYDATKDVGKVGSNGHLGDVTTFSFDSPSNDFNYISFHLGFGDLFFKFASPILKFTAETRGTANGFSTFYAYDTIAKPICTVNCGGGGPTPPVPVPAAVWLFGSGMLGLMSIKRRKNQLKA